MKYYKRLLELSSIVEITDELFLTAKYYFKEISEGEIEVSNDYLCLTKDNYEIKYNKIHKHLFIDSTMFEDCKLLFKTDDHDKIKNLIVTFLKHFGLDLPDYNEIEYLQIVMPIRIDFKIDL